MGLVWIGGGLVGFVRLLGYYTIDFSKQHAIEKRGGSSVSAVETNEARFWLGLKSSLWPARSLPETLVMPERLMDNIEELWNRMFEDPQHNEQGACIVLDAESILKLDDRVIGESSQAVKPKCRVCERPDHLGFFHTHWLLDGDAQVGFSHHDFAGVLEDGESLSLVCSANQIFALIRTEKSSEPAPVTKLREREFLEVFVQYIRKGLRSKDAARMANHDLCRRLGLAFYAGRLRQPLNLEVAP